MQDMIKWLYMKTLETDFLLALSEKASQMMRDAYSPTGTNVVMKEDYTPVTETDIAINQMVIDETKKAYPEWGVLGEELEHNAEAARLIVVDPVDGTRPFSFGVPVFGFMAAVVDAGIPIASVITNPIAGRTLYAHKGEGAWHLESGMQLSVSNNDTLERSVCDISSSSVWFSHIRRRLRGDYKANIPSFSAVAEVASMIALGHLTASIGLWKSPHDMAAAKILIEEAGGKVTDLDGKEQLYNTATNGGILSNGLTHQALQDLYEHAREDYDQDHLND